MTAQEINFLATWIIIFLCIICVLAIAGIVIYNDVSRRKFERDIKLSRRDYMAETIFANLKAGPHHTIEVWHDEMPTLTPDQISAWSEFFKASEQGKHLREGKQP